MKKINDKTNKIFIISRGFKGFIIVNTKVEKNVERRS